MRFNDIMNHDVIQQYYDVFLYHDETGGERSKNPPGSTGSPMVQEKSTAGKGKWQMSNPRASPLANQSAYNIGNHGRHKNLISAPIVGSFPLVRESAVAISAM